MFGAASEAPSHLWQDREIRFDVPVSSLEPRAGEFSIDNMVRVLQDWTDLAAQSCIALPCTIDTMAHAGEWAALLLHACCTAAEHCT